MMKVKQEDDIKEYNRYHHPAVADMVVSCDMENDNEMMSILSTLHNNNKSDVPNPLRNNEETVCKYAYTSDVPNPLANIEEYNCKEEDDYNDDSVKEEEEEEEKEEEEEWDEEDDDDDLESSLLFLKQKQDILKRVSDFMNSDEIYEASIARESQRQDSEIFTEAKEFIADLDRKNNGTADDCDEEISPDQIRSNVTFDVVTPKTTTTEGRKRRKTSRRSKRARRRIDISLVDVVNSESYYGHQTENNNSMNTTTTTSSSEITPSPYDDVSWLQTLEQVHDDLNNTNNAKERQSRDECKNISERNSTFRQISSTAAEITATREMKPDYSTTIEDALAITDQPQIIFQASFPFIAIHANRAFFNLSKLSTEDVVGKSVEKIVGNEYCCMGDILLAASSLQDSTQLDSKKSNNDDAIIVLGGIYCRLQVKPISSNSNSRNHTLSHLMVKIQVINERELISTATVAPTERIHQQILVGAI